MRVAGPNAAALLTKILGAAPEAANGVLHAPADAPAITVIVCPGPTRVSSYTARGGNSKPSATALDADVIFTGAEPWRLLDILTGTPTIYPRNRGSVRAANAQPATAGRISFQKGCYTGQEIVARTHYLRQAEAANVFGARG